MCLPSHSLQLLLSYILPHIKLWFYELMTRNGSEEQNRRGGSEKGDEKRRIFILLQPLPLLPLSSFAARYAAALPFIVPK